jgi:hypothetical protein
VAPGSRTRGREGTKEGRQAGSSGGVAAEYNGWGRPSRRVTKRTVSSRLSSMCLSLDLELVDGKLEDAAGVEKEGAGAQTRRR